MADVRYHNEPSTFSTLLGLAKKRQPPRHLPEFPEDVAVMRHRVPVAHRLAAYHRALNIPDTGALPPLYPHVMCGRMHLAMFGWDAFPVAMLGAVHTRTHVRQTVALPTDGSYTLRSWFHTARSVKRGMEFTLASTASLDGEVVWSSINAYQVKGRFGEPESAPAEATIERPQDATEKGKWNLPANLGRTYAGICGDWNPIHISNPTAKMFGFKGAIVHGYANLAIGLSRLDLPNGPLAVDAAFKGPCFLGGTAWVAQDDERRFSLHSPADERPSMIGRWSTEPTPLFDPR